MPSEIRLQIVDDQALVRDALAAAFDRARGFSVVGVAATVSEARAAADKLRPSIVLLDVLSEPAFFEEVSAFQSDCPQLKFVLLDEAVHESHAREALRLKLSGYLTRQQPLVQIEAALRQIAIGERAFVPQIAERLVFSVDGVRLMPHERDGKLARLTPREMDVFIYIAQGYSVRRCAETLGISSSTVDNHKSRLMKKLGVHKNIELAQLAMREGIDLGRNRRSRS